MPDTDSRATTRSDRMHCNHRRRTIPLLVLAAGAHLAAQSPAPIEAPLADRLPALAEQSSWAQDTRYEGEQPDKRQRGTYPIGNGYVFAYQGLGARANTLQAITGPRYQTDAVFEPRGHFGACSLELSRDGAPLALPQQRVRRVLGAAAVVSEDRGDDVALRVLTFAAPERRHLVRVIDVVNTGPDELAGLRLRVAVEGTAAALGEDGLALVYASERRPASAVLRLAGAAFADGGLTTALPTLAAGERWRGVLSIHTRAGATPDADSAPVLDVEAAAREAEGVLAWWRFKLRDTLQVDTDHHKLRDLVTDWKVLMLTQRCATSGAVSPMINYRGAWVRDSVGPMLWFLRTNLWAEARGILSYLYRATRLHNRVPNHVPLDLDFAPLAERETDWTTVAVPESEVPSWIILMHYWYWRATRDAALIRDHWSLLEVCLKRQQRGEGGVMPFHGDETYLHGALYSLYPDRVGAGSGFIAEDRWRGRKTHSLASGVQFLLAVLAMGELRDAVDALLRPDAWARGRPDDAPGQPYLEQRVPVQRALEDAFWLEEEGFFAPALSPVNREPHRLPFANVNLMPLWLGWTFPSGERSRDNLRNTLAGLWRDGVRIGTTPTVGYATGHAQGMLLAGLSERDAASRLDCLDALLEMAEPAGEWGEIHDPDGRPVAAYHAEWPNRCRPWEGGINMDAILFSLCGSRYASLPNWDLDDIRLEPRLPHGGTFVTFKHMRKDARDLHLFVYEHTAPLSEEERAENLRLPADQRRDPRAAHRRLAFRLEQLSADPPAGFRHLAANSVGTLFTEFVRRGVPIEKSEFWGADHLQFMPAPDTPPRPPKVAPPSVAAGTERIVLTSRQRGADIGGKGAVPIDTGLPCDPGQIGSALLRDGAPAARELLLDWGWNDPGRTTFKPEAFWQDPAWLRALDAFRAGGGVVHTPGFVSSYVVEGQSPTVTPAPGGRLELAADVPRPVRVRARWHADRAGEALLWIGSGCGLQARFNGDALYEHSGGRHPLPDLDRVLVQLREGDNELEITLREGGNAVLYARCTDLEGRPLTPTAQP